MTGICGWVRPDPQSDTRPDEGIAVQMSRQLPGFNGPRFESAMTGTVAGRVSELMIGRADVSGCIAAIDGEPQWRSTALKSQARKKGDVSALISAYEAHGSDFFERLGGSFAIAVYDQIHRRLLLAVDRMGIRPLCYTLKNSNAIVFGSTTRSVIAHGKIGTQLSAQSLYDYIFFHVIPSPATVFENIRKLEPGQYIQFEDGAYQCKHYWTPDFSRQFSQNESELRENLFEQLRSSVASAQPDEKTGTFLSGGLDSSTVSGLANEASHGKLRAYTIGFQQQGYDEMEFASAAAAHFQLDHRQYYVTPNDIMESVEFIVNSYDEPFGNSSAIPAYFCAKVAKEDGIDRMLAGDGGDELFAGNERYATQRIFEIYQKFPSVFRRFFIEPALFNLPTNWSSLTRKAKRYVEQARISMPMRLQTYNHLCQQSPFDVFSAEFLERVNTDSPQISMQSWYDKFGDCGLVNKMLAYDWKLTLADNDLRKVNRMCESVGIGVSYPLLDDDLVNYSMALPPAYKLKHGQLRYLFRQAVREYLPQQILSKRKHGFGLPFGEWLTHQRGLEDQFQNYMNRMKSRKIFRNGFLDELKQMHRQGHAAYYGNLIWVICVLEIWLTSNENAWTCDI